MPAAQLEVLNPTKLPPEVIRELVRLAHQPGIVRAELARRYGVSRQTLYHYLHTHEEARHVATGDLIPKPMMKDEQSEALTFARSIIGYAAAGRPVREANETAVRMARLVAKLVRHIEEAEALAAEEEATEHLSGVT